VAAAATCVRCPSSASGGRDAVGRPLLDLVGAHRDVVHDRAVPRIKVIHHPLVTLMQKPAFQ
jgi:hypothetical protein